MWILEQSNKDRTKFKYLSAYDYNDIISYINRFSNVKKYNDYLYVSRDDIYFRIYLGEELNYEKADKKEIINKETIYSKEYRQFRDRNKKTSKKSQC